MAGFDLALARVQQNNDQLLIPDRINELARQQDHNFRGRFSHPATPSAGSCEQVAHGNVACSAVRHLAGEEFSDSALVPGTGAIADGSDAARFPSTD